MRVRSLIPCAVIFAGCVDDTLDLTATRTPEDRPPSDLYATQPIHLAAGPEHTCLRRGDASLWCWGSNDNGQITPGVWNVYEGHPIPTRAEGVGAVVTLAAGGDEAAQGHSCAVDISGRVHCFGSGWNGQIGGLGSVGVAEPSGLENIVSVSAGGAHTCAIDAEGAVYCWGDNRLGQLGRGSSSLADKIPAQIQFSGKARAVALGTYHSCALDEKNKVWCWGNNAGFQLGVDISSTATPPEGGGFGCGRETIERCVNPTPVPVDSLPPIARIAAGFGETCAIDDAGAVWCWGYDQYRPDGELPHKIDGLGYSFRVAPGQNHTCAITADRHVWCWGVNSDHQLGAFPADGSNISKIPVEVEGVTQAIELASGSAHTCALTESGAVWCWGSNLKGQLGTGTEARLVTPAPGTIALENATSLSARGQSVCATTTENRAYCWGRLQPSWSGKNALLPAAVPTEISNLPDVANIETSGAHACALTVDGQIYCWGENSRGQVSPAGAERIDDPIKVERAESATQLTLGSEHTCALGDDDHIRCWGDNSQLQLGEPGIEDIRRPKLLKSAGTRTCVIEGEDRTLTCWGNLSNRTPLEPARVPGLRQLTDLSLGHAHTCALDEAGRVFCFGSNSRGQLGDGCRFPTASCRDHGAVPYEVQEIPPMRAIFASTLDTCAISAADSALWCWGDAFGAWRDTPDGPRYMPVQVDEPSQEISTLSFGRWASCTLGADRAVRCWGSNLSGERGDGQRFSRIPEIVQF